MLRYHHLIRVFSAFAILTAAVNCGCREEKKPVSKPQMRAEFELGEGFPIEVPMHFKGSEYRFVFDTGCGLTSFNSIHKDMMGPHVRSETATGSLKQNISLDYHELENDANFGIGRINIAGRVGVSDYSQFGQWMEEYDGLLGMDALSHFIVQMDFIEGTLRIFDPGLQDPCDWGYPFELHFSGGTPHLGVELPGGIMESFMIDTGAPRCYLKQDLFEKLLHHFRPNAEYTPREITHDTDSLTGVPLKDFHLGPMVYEEILICEYPRSFLGMEFLRKHALVTFDFPDSKMYLKPLDDSESAAEP